MDFILVIGILLMLVPLLAKLYGVQLKVEKPNCPEDVDNVKKNKLNIIIFEIAGCICIIAWAIYKFCFIV